MEKINSKIFSIGEGRFKEIKQHLENWSTIKTIATAERYAELTG